MLKSESMPGYPPGTMEEKIIQRQLRKGELEQLVVDDGGDSTKRNFNSADLKDIFILEKTCCETYDVLACNDGLVTKSASSRVSIDALHCQRVGGYRCTRPQHQALVEGPEGGEAGREDPQLSAAVQSSTSVSFIMSLLLEMAHAHALADPRPCLRECFFSCGGPADVCMKLDFRFTMGYPAAQVAQELGQGGIGCD